jgi:ribosomal protein L14
MFVKGAAKIVEPPRIEYKGFKVRFNLKGDVCRGFVIRTRFNSIRADGGKNYFKSNDLILIKKRQEPKSKYLFGPVSKLLFRKRFLTLFAVVI